MADVREDSNWLIRAQHRYGTTLVQRGADEDVQRARALFDEAHEAATAHGMARLAELTSAALLDAGGALR